MITFLMNTDGERIHCLLSIKEKCNIDDANAEGEKVKKVDFRRAAAAVIIEKYDICKHCLGGEAENTTDFI